MDFIFFKSENGKMTSFKFWK